MRLVRWCVAVMAVTLAVAVGLDLRDAYAPPAQAGPLRCEVVHGY
jgi:hypothetical protein